MIDSLKSLVLNDGLFFHNVMKKMMMGENGFVFITYLRNSVSLFYNCDKFNDKTYLSLGISSLKT